ncbi:MAG: hypothetical protein MJ089_02055 [Ruminococcus sp.]|nr:hypothetical protein [Ruminococcus sp.]
MKKIVIAVLCALSLLTTISGCQKSDDKPVATNDSAVNQTADDTTDKEAFDPYLIENVTSVPKKYIDKHNNVDYGTIDEDVKYYSETAQDYKMCNVLLPANYDKNEKYPVMYAIHGWGGDYTGQIHQDSYLQILYGNMLKDNLTVPMIIVSVDMYTDKLADKESKTEEELRLCYDKVIYDIRNDLMPFIENTYPIKTGRENTAIAGVSQGASESLATGFIHQDVIGYIASFAPDPGVIPTEFYKDTYWNWPVMDDFEITDGNEPYYLYLTVGDEDPWNVETTLYYGEVLTLNGIKNQTDLVKGYEHDGDFWRLGYYNYLGKIFK